MEKLLAKDLSSLPLAAHQHGFRAKHSTTTLLCHLTHDIATGFNKKRPPDRTVLAAVDLSQAFDRVNIDKLLRHLLQSTLNPAVTRWLAVYLRGRMARTLFRDATSNAKIVHTGVPQGSCISPCLFNFIMSKMPVPDHPTRLKTYADDIIVYITSNNINLASEKITSYLSRLNNFLENNGLIVSLEKTTVTLFTPDPRQARTHPPVAMFNSQLKLEKTQKLLGVTYDTMLTFGQHTANVCKKVARRNNALRALSGLDWGQDKETQLITYRAIGRSCMDYASPPWTPIISKTNQQKLQTIQNTALRTATGAIRLTSIDHLHNECKMLKVAGHHHLLNNQLLAQATQDTHPCNHLWTLEQQSTDRDKKMTLHASSSEEVASFLTDDLEQTLKQLHTHAVAEERAKSQQNRVLKRPPPETSKDEELSRYDRRIVSA